MVDRACPATSCPTDLGGVWYSAWVSASGSLAVWALAWSGAHGGCCWFRSATLAWLFQPGSPFDCFRFLVSTTQPHFGHFST